MIYGAMRDKAIREVGRILFPLAEKVVLTRAGGNPRAATTSELVEAVGDCGTPLVEAPNVAEAVRLALAEAQPFGAARLAGHHRLDLCGGRGHAGAGHTALTFSKRRPALETLSTIVYSGIGRRRPKFVADIHKPSAWDRLCSYLFRDPLIYLYTVVLGTASLLCSLFDGSGRRQHWLARAWSWLILKTASCPVTIDRRGAPGWLAGLCLCRQPHFGPGYSRAVRSAAVSIPHHGQEGAVPLSVSGMASAALGTDSD